MGSGAGFRTESLSPTPQQQVSGAGFRTESLSPTPQHHTQHQDAEHSANEESQRKERQECHQEGAGEGQL